MIEPGHFRIPGKRMIAITGPKALDTGWRDAEIKRLITSLKQQYVHSGGFAVLTTHAFGTELQAAAEARKQDIPYVVVLPWLGYRNTWNGGSPGWAATLQEDAWKAEYVVPNVVRNTEQGWAVVREVLLGSCDELIVLWDDNEKDQHGLLKAQAVGRVKLTVVTIPMERRKTSSTREKAQNPVSSHPTLFSCATEDEAVKMFSTPLDDIRTVTFRPNAGPVSMLKSRV